MKPQFKKRETKDYISHVILHGEIITPSDSFEIGDHEYALLKILKSTEGVIYLNLICINGENLGNMYLIPKDDFENKTLSEIQQSLQDYQS